ncbi:unnamed protein product [Protopolystoma xenopodis]|uniref:Uncharacterized protein n=1 Tax=Protopolystoma xenopodis TaxID=117903 RepID=A0A448XL74_9PLAT|nr:unnamed protein product [Protopolystoma xenopodis]
MTTAISAIEAAEREARRRRLENIMSRVKKPPLSHALANNEDCPIRCSDSIGNSQFLPVTGHKELNSPPCHSGDCDERADYFEDQHNVHCPFPSPLDRETLASSANFAIVDASTGRGACQYHSDCDGLMEENYESKPKKSSGELGMSQNSSTYVYIHEIEADSVKGLPSDTTIYSSSVASLNLSPVHPTEWQKSVPDAKTTGNGTEIKSIGSKYSRADLRSTLVRSMLASGRLSRKSQAVAILLKGFAETSQAAEDISIEGVSFAQAQVEAYRSRNCYSPGQGFSILIFTKLYIPFAELGGNKRA